MSGTIDNLLDSERRRSQAAKAGSLQGLNRGSIPRAASRNKAPVGAGTPTEALTRTAEPHEDRNSIIRPVSADFNKGVRHDR